MDILEPLIEKSPADYTEARFHKREKNQIILRKGEVEDITNETYAGVGIRVLLDGAWGFSSINSTDTHLLQKALKTAIKMARAASEKKKEPVTLQEVTPAAGEFRPVIKDPLSNHSLEEKIDLCVETDKSVQSHKSIKSSFIYYQEFIDSKWIVTSDGSHVHIYDSKPQFYVGAVAGRGHDLVSYMDAVGITGGWELFRKSPPESMVEKATSAAAALLDAPYSQGGKTPVILDPGLVGLLSHEAVGHTMEADSALSEAVTTEKMGEKVASEMVTMVDSGKIQAGGWIPVDDEGVTCTDVTLIDHGLLTAFLHNRETASTMDTAPTGNARAWEYDFEPIVRMRNTYIEKGDWNQEEIIEDTRKGYLLKGAGGGQADSNAEFMFQVKEAYSIDHGEVGHLLRGVIMMGNAFDVLSSVDAVGKTVDFDMGFGACGKNQPAKVDGGGPFIRCDVFVGGR
jgi:TldD protein